MRIGCEKPLVVTGSNLAATQSFNSVVSSLRSGGECAVFDVAPARLVDAIVTEEGMLTASDVEKRGTLR